MLQRLLQQHGSTVRYVKIWIHCTTTARNFVTKRDIAPAYKPSLVEAKVHANDSLPRIQYNNAKHELATGKRYSILLPPPNVTGELHLGHALTCAVQDALIRYARNNGKTPLWIPGMDHAGIATQVVVEKRIRKDLNVSRHELGRERFLEEILRWKKEKECTIRSALHQLGCSMDWHREYFTMDEQQSVAVKEAFVRLFENGLVYRDKSLVNWSCSLESAISDVEVESLQLDGPTALAVPGYNKSVTFGQLVDIAYRVQGSTEEIVVSTTRPETFLGDVAVAVHPEDGRYSHLRNKSTFLWHPVRKEDIPLIFDESVDRAFGTGAVKITPAHDRFDFEIARKHQLATVEVLNEQGIVREHFDPFSGLPRYEARERLMDYLSKLSLLRGIRPHAMVLPVCSRSKDVVELLLRPQWFVRCREMAQRAVAVVQDGKLQIIPKVFEREWFRWLEDCHDWCISRQLWWGHRIPAFRVQHGGRTHWVAARSLAEAREKYVRQIQHQAENVSNEPITVEQDTDVLDTWFSSALLPFSTTGWPHAKSPNKEEYPLDLMETGHDILFFWVARMVMLGQELTGELPFRKVLLHGIICDEHGRKMSKSLGNVIKPDHVIQGITLERLEAETDASFRQGILSELELKKSLAGQRKMFPDGIAESGTDALRFTLCSVNVKNHFIHFNAQEAHTNKLFFNKIWQATRYTLGCLEHFPLATKQTFPEANRLCMMDRWILSRLASTIQVCSEAFEGYNFHLATAALKTFFYTNLCDVYLETTKINMKTEHAAKASVQCAVLHHCLTTGLCYLEPFAPFLAAELLSHLALETKMDEFNTSLQPKIDSELEANVDQLLLICQHIRQSKNEHIIPIVRKHNPVAHIYVRRSGLYDLVHSQESIIRQLTLCHNVLLHTEEASFDRLRPNFAVQSSVNHECTVGVVADGLDFSSKDNGGVAMATHTKKVQKLEAEIEKLCKTVNNEGYRKSASEAVQKKHQERLKELQKQREEIIKMAPQR
ncbi:valine--tRNA ligase isoform X2 [Anopheles bellator]|uniref:valine--tRNA ligase isoform X2 n=1 Tax=Anopheles bellator TaxID=139047 RepID=UPI0026472C85|nr:valine--tRNA ligase isoform X2 [Anopheles bellator]